MTIKDYDNELLHMARDLAVRLLPAFENTKTGIPYPRVSECFSTGGNKPKAVIHLSYNSSSVPCVCPYMCTWGFEPALSYIKMVWGGTAQSYGDIDIV